MHSISSESNQERQRSYEFDCFPFRLMGYFPAIGMWMPLSLAVCLGDLVAGVGMAGYTDAGVVVEDACDFLAAMSVPSATVTWPAWSE